MLDNYLSQGLGVWIADYKIAKRDGHTQIAETILEGIRVYAHKIPFREREQLQEMLNDENSYLEYEINPTMISEAKNILGTDSQEINENLLRRAVGAATGFAVGPALGKVIADVFGLDRDSILRDFLESRLVGSALGSAVAKRF